MSSFLFCQTLTSVKYQECVVRVVTISKEALNVHVLKVTSWILMAENAVRKVVVKTYFLLNLLQSYSCYFTDFYCNVYSCPMKSKKGLGESPFLCCFIALLVSRASQYDNWRSTAPHFLNLLTILKRIGHFRVPPGLCFKTRVGAQPLIWKSFFILMQIKLIFTRKVVHLASF